MKLLKDEDRKRIKAILAGITAEQRARWSSEACARVIDSEQFKQADILMCYAALEQEINPSGIISAALHAGKTVAYPICISSSKMIAARPALFGEWNKNGYGVWEPVREEADEIPPKELELIIVPGLAFDENLWRLGRGAGYYDRFLSMATNAFFMGFAYEKQILEKVAYGEHDTRMHAVATESRIITCQ